MKVIPVEDFAVDEEVHEVEEGPLEPEIVGHQLVVVEVGHAAVFRVPGVNVVITNFSDFCQVSAKQIGVFF
jgi:hypothetical protein